ncbi:hypothetical protein C500_06726 [Natrialba magadii ATCC 43099]|nr:hypothetical protein C500_06726 [Natrialba magadii ATCC 43099]
MDDVDYQLDYVIDMPGDGEVSNSGAIRYERKKYAADASFYTWQSGTWVNAYDDTNYSARDTTHFPASNNSRVTIEELSSTMVDLQLDSIYGYFENENNDDFPQTAFAEYAFDVAWSALDNGTPFWLPPRPPSVGDDSSIDIDRDASGKSAEISYPDPIPSMIDFDTTTHSADWKWEIGGGGIDAGWNYVGANREVDNGHYMYNSDSGHHFEIDRGHQIALGSAFCIYQEDESICETDDCPGGPPCPEVQVRSCCELSPVAKPIQISDAHLSEAKDKAETHVDAIDHRTDSRFEDEAITALEEAAEAETRFRELVAYRSATAHSKGSVSRESAANGEINEQNIKRRAKEVESKISAAHKRVKYQGESVNQVLATTGQIEKCLLSAQSWLDSVFDALSFDAVSEPEQIQYADSALEFAHGNLDDGEQYLETATRPPDGPVQKEAVLERYKDIERMVRKKLEDAPGDSNRNVEYAVSNAKGYFERAQKRFETGYTTAAGLDLYYALAYLKAASQLNGDLPDVIDISTLEVEQELTADRFNQAVSSINCDLERFLLKLARLEFNSGTESFGAFEATNDDREGFRAYTHYLIADTIVDGIDDSTLFASPPQ